jgi:hypothetical protein
MIKLKNLLLLLVVFFANQLCAIPAQNSIAVNKCYATEENVFLLVNSRWLSAEAVNFTTNGIFVMEDGEWLSIEEAIRCDTYWTWTCNNCGAANVQGYDTCINCGETR